VRTRAVDGFNVLPRRLPGTVEDVADRLVPEPQERGVYRTEYEGTTLREHLDLPDGGPVTRPVARRPGR
jgi:hypothetical protein